MLLAAAFLPQSRTLGSGRLPERNCNRGGVSRNHQEMELSFPAPTWGSRGAGEGVASHGWTAARHQPSSPLQLALTCRISADSHSGLHGHPQHSAWPQQRGPLALCGPAARQA